ncbi:MATE family efflux transporter [Pseudoflavonifractor sp. 524-17]|uniref:MATE family efflux transporter n=1 Tax=Pseudoflavonifractor sp. 524-17 TaxID=2304577 RepID=UPI0013798FCD|nr:MATE family efflux transporter [Pseudoflavonifractor sp. 524-17]NCE65280.1 MATE family efflux transporter [Pseudoflavonifractor sp. 524-17]
MTTNLLGGGTRLKTMWRLSWPAIMEQILSTMVSYVDTAMVGVLGAGATAAVSVNAASLWLISGILAGVGVGYSVQVSNAIGAGDDSLARDVIRQGILGTLVCGAVSLVIFQILAGYIPLWLGAKPDVLPHAAAYLRYYTLAMPWIAASAIFSAILRCMGNTKAPLIFNTLANLCNLALNCLFIYETRTVRLLGRAVTVPGAGLGVEGAAIASALSWTVAGSALLFIGLRQGDRFRVRFAEGLRPNRAIIRMAVYLGLPSALERATINLGQIALTALVASIGTVALAAHQIANTAEGLCYLPAYGISYAGIALVGQSVGARSKEDAKAFGSLAALAALILCTVLAVLLFLFAPMLSALFNTDPAVVREAALMLRIVCFAEPPFALSIVLSGTLRGAHDVRFPMATGLVCMWGVRITLALVLVGKAGLGLAGVWIAMSADLILRGVLCTLRWHGEKWVKKCGL